MPRAYVGADGAKQIEYQRNMHQVGAAAHHFIARSPILLRCYPVNILI